MIYKSKYQVLWFCYVICKISEIFISSLLGIFWKVQKHLLLWHVCLSVHMYHLSSHRTDFHEIFYWNILLKSVQKTHIWLKVDKNIWHLTLRLRFQYFRRISCLHYVIRAQENKCGSIASHIIIYLVEENSVTGLLLWFTEQYFSVLHLLCGGLSAQRSLTQCMLLVHSHV